MSTATQTAQDAFLQQKELAYEQMYKLFGLLNDYSADDAANWADVGTVSHLAAELSRLVQFISA